MSILNSRFKYINGKKVLCTFKEPTRHEIQGFIYNNLIPPAKQMDIHEMKMKDFTFTKIFSEGKKYCGNDVVTYSNSFCSIDISSLNDSVIDLIQSYTSYKRLYRIGQLFVKIDRIEEKEHSFNGSIFKVKTVEPIYLYKQIEKGNKKYVTCNDSEFKNFLLYSINKQFGSKLSEKDLDITRSKQRLERYKGNIYHTVSQCEFMIHCDEETISKMYYNGIGNLNGSGFGKINIIGQYDNR